MPIQLAFHYTVPPPSETVYCLEWPCPRAPGTVAGAGGCLYGAICKASAPAWEVLKRTYRRIKVTLSESASSIVVRSEHQFSRDTRLRLSLRKHFYELRSSVDEGEADVQPCASIDPRDRFARYLGFIDVRPHAKKAPLAMGLLVPPRALRHDPYAFVATGEYGALFGGHSFQCTPYSMHEPDTGGAYCAQACVMMALAALADRGARIVGSYTLTYLAKKGRVVPNRGPQCTANTAPLSPFGSFKVGGLDPNEMVELFEQCQTSACHVNFPDNPIADRLAERLLAAYVEARCPAILFVDSVRWWDWEALGGEALPHTVVVVGLSRSQPAHGNSLASLIVHDPGFRPYYKRALGACFSAMKAYDEPRMHIVFVADAPVKRHACECVKYLTRSSESAWWREYYEGCDLRDYRICLVYRDDIRATFFPSQRTEIRCRGDDYERRYIAAREELSRHRDAMSRTWYWCVVGYDRDSRIDVVWLFDASLGTQEFSGWVARLDVSGDVKLEFASRSLPTVGTGATDRTLAEGTPGKPDYGPRKPSSPLEVSVLTSCSDLPLSTMFADLKKTSACRLFDLFILRDIDIREIEHSHGTLNPPATETPDDRSIALIMADEGNYARIKAWLLQQCATAPELKIAALATYFPDISSVSTSRLNRAVGALTNAVRLAIELKTHGYMATPIVELVCGSKLDRCDCDDCRGEQRIWEYQEKDKIEWLLRSLREVKSRVNKVFPFERFAFALELEPGETYAIHDENSLATLAEAVLADEEGLARYCGINVDVAHMRAAEVKPSVLEKYSRLITHAHICDLPFRMHTRDQPVGRWCPLDTAHSHHWEYLDVLALRSANPNSDTQLPFSGAVAIELEGCARANWIHESVAELREMIGH